VKIRALACGAGRGANAYGPLTGTNVLSGNIPQFSGEVSTIGQVVGIASGVGIGRRGIPEMAVRIHSRSRQPVTKVVDGAGRGSLASGPAQLGCDVGIRAWAVPPGPKGTTQVSRFVEGSVDQASDCKPERVDQSQDHADSVTAAKLLE